MDNKLIGINVVYNIYRVIFLVDSEEKRKIEKIIVCPSYFNEKQTEKLVFQKFNRVKKVLMIVLVSSGVSLNE
ncbi:hypothetical protein [Carnobacterium maltaromaticum]|uniref:hypothetical protein n=1 Tax=Carnobacterium maltaromaticum TaxID=2751 RepID=UPI00295E5704|nr:hypothetical protein [Carnobacterium maltaromaticum]